MQTLEAEFWVDDALVSPNEVELSEGLPVAARLDIGTKSSIRLPAEWVIKEFSDFALDVDGIELQIESVASWLDGHLRRHPEDVFVLVAMLGQAERSSSGPGGKNAREPKWRWIATEQVTRQGDQLVVDGRCERISGT